MVPLHTSFYPSLHPTQALNSNDQEFCSTPSIKSGYEPTLGPVINSDHILLVCSNVVSSLTPVSNIITSFVPAFESAELVETAGED